MGAGEVYSAVSKLCIQQSFASRNLVSSLSVSTVFCITFSTFDNFIAISTAECLSDSETSFRTFPHLASDDEFISSDTHSLTPSEVTLTGSCQAPACLPSINGKRNFRMKVEPRRGSQLGVVLNATYSSAALYLSLPTLKQGRTLRVTRRICSSLGLGTCDLANCLGSYLGKVGKIGRGSSR